MIPVKWVLAGHLVPVHAIMEMAAFYTGAWLYARLSRRNPDPLSSHHRTLVIAAAALGALVGSRLLALLELPETFRPASITDVLISLYQNKTIVGGLLGGLVGVEAVKKWMGVRRRSGDLFTYPLLAALIVGRFGCFLAGVEDGTAGTVSSLPWAFDQGDGLPRHPTALYEIGFLAVSWAVLRKTQSIRPLKEGQLFAIFMSAYLAWRFLVEFIKPVEPLALQLSAIQWSCLIGLFHYVRLFAGSRFDPTPVFAD